MKHKENNTLIANFMGLELYKDSKEFDKIIDRENLLTNRNNLYRGNINSSYLIRRNDALKNSWYTCLAENLGYEKSWDKLMQVVEKIEDSGANCRIGKTWIIIWKDDSREFPVCAVQYNTKIIPKKKIVGVFEAIVLYIEWYNLKQH